jgi:hypothetical protein
MKANLTRIAVASLFAVLAIAVCNAQTAKVVKPGKVKVIRVGHKGLHKKK